MTDPTRAKAPIQALRAAAAMMLALASARWPVSGDRRRRSRRASRKLRALALAVAPLAAAGAAVGRRRSAPGSRSLSAASAERRAGSRRSAIPSSSPCVAWTCAHWRLEAGAGWFRSQLRGGAAAGSGGSGLGLVDWSSSPRARSPPCRSIASRSAGRRGRSRRSCSGRTSGSFPGSAARTGLGPAGRRAGALRRPARRTRASRGPALPDEPRPAGAPSPVGPAHRAARPPGPLGLGPLGEILAGGVDHVPVVARREPQALGH